MHREAFFKLPLSERDPHLSSVSFSEVSSAREDRLLLQEKRLELCTTPKLGPTLVHEKHIHIFDPRNYCKIQISYSEHLNSYIKISVQGFRYHESNQTV